MNEYTNEHFDFDNIIKILEFDAKKRKLFKSWIINELNLYKKILNNLDIDNLNIPEISTYESQIFECNFHFTNCNSNSFFKPMWSITKAKNIIKNESIPLSKISVKEYSEFFNNTDVKRHYAETTDLSNPLIFVDFDCIKAEMVLIDGNHRFYNAMLKNVEYIKAYKLNEEQSLRALAKDEYQVLYKIYKNLWYIINIDFQKKYNYDDKELFQLNNTLIGTLHSRYLLKNML